MDIGGYHVVTRLGRGGMGEVLLARAESAGGLARPCVVKRIVAREASEQGRAGRFLDEARLSIQLSHRNIAGVTHVGADGDAFFLVMEFVAGRDLRDILRRLNELGRRMTTACALYVAKEILEALDYAHRLVDARNGQPLGIVHRDVSPSNIMVSVEGEVKLIDFGLAQSALKLERTQAGMVVGKVAYMAPEHARGEAVDVRADLYSLGIVLAELLAGRGYYESIERPQLLALAQKGYRSPILDELDDDFARCVKRALAPAPAERAASAAELRDGIDDLMRSHGMVVGPSDLRTLMRELFPDEVERQRTLLAAALSPERAGDLASLLNPLIPPPSIHEERTASTDPKREMTELIRSRVGDTGHDTVPMTFARRRVAAVAAAALLLSAAAAVAFRLAQAEPEPEPAPTAPSTPATAPPATAPTTTAAPGTERDGALEEEDDDDDLEEPTVAPAGAGKKPAKAKPVLSTVAQKIKFLERCKKHCARPVLDKYARFGALTVDEARSFGIDLDSCVKRCGG